MAGRGNRVVVVAPTKGQVRRIHELLHEWGLEIDVDLGRISEGFQLKSFNQIFIAEHEIFGRTHKHRHRRKPRSRAFSKGAERFKGWRLSGSYRLWHWFVSRNT